MPNKFRIFEKQGYLSKSTVGYFNRDYKGFGKPDNPEFLNTLKNTYNSEPLHKLNAARDEVISILIDDIPTIMTENDLKSCVCVCIPRAKALDTYTSKQLFFRDAVSIAASNIPNVIDGSCIIQRHTNTKTTHLAKAKKQSHVVKDGTSTKLIEGNDGDSPYPCITKKTCRINSSAVYNQNVILIDDIYTQGVNIDEDAIQAMLDNGARSVIFYAIAYTRRD